MSLALRKLKKTQHLPPGHIAKKAAEEAVNREYANCLEIQNKWCKRFNPNFTPQQALQFCNELCEMLGERRLKEIIIYSPEVEDVAHAHYDGQSRSIHFKWHYIDFGVLMHELAHHFKDCYRHDKYYCWTLDFLFRMAYTKVTGKQPKKDW